LQNRHTNTTINTGGIFMRRLQKSLVLVLLATSLTIIGCSGKSDEEMAMEQNKTMVQRYVEEFNKHNVDYLDEYMAPDYSYHRSGKDMDKEAFKKFHSGVLSAFPDAVITAEDMIASGEKIVTRWRIQGTHKGVFHGVAPTGNKINITGIIISKFANGKCVEEWEEADGVGLMQQLGVIPTPKNN
jgi:steroid delta-isomerase-like uncharacterized protein